MTAVEQITEALREAEKARVAACLARSMLQGVKGAPHWNALEDLRHAEATLDGAIEELQERIGQGH